MTTLWSHLPNAKHIHRIVDGVRSNPDQWAMADRKVFETAYDAGWNASRDVAKYAARDTDCDRDRKVAWNAARHAIAGSGAAAATDAGGYAILALIVWDEAADYLNLSVDQVKMLAALGSHKAMLLLPAVLVFEKSKELV